MARCDACDQPVDLVESKVSNRLLLVDRTPCQSGAFVLDGIRARWWTGPADDHLPRLRGHVCPNATPAPNAFDGDAVDARRRAAIRAAQRQRRTAP